MRKEFRGCSWLMSDKFWRHIQPLLPKYPPPSSRGGRPRVNLRQVMDGIFYVLRTGCQWKALDTTGICSGSTAHLRFQEWVAAGVFLMLWQAGLERYDDLKGLDWSWLSMDGAMTKAPLGGEKNRQKPDRSGQGGRQTKSVDRSQRPAHRVGR